MDRDSFAWAAFGYGHGLQLFADDLEWFANIVGDSEALQKLPRPLGDLVRTDAKTLEDGILSFEPNGRVESVETRLSNAKRAATEVYERLGFEVPYFDVHIADRFPDPYDDDNLWGLTLDYQDARDTGAAAGIYMRASTAFPLLAEATLCHELVHTLFSLVEASHLVRGYEEGVCDLISFIALSNLFGDRYAKNVFVRYRLFTRDPFDFAYRDALRQACSTVLAIGGDAWLALMQHVQANGRAIFPHLEECLITGESLPVAIDDGRPSVTPEGLSLESLSLQLLATPESYVLSPPAFAVAQAATVGDTLHQLSAKLPQLGDDQVAVALNELGNTLRLVVVDQGIITANEAPLYLRTRSVRYSNAY